MIHAPNSFRQEGSAAWSNPAGSILTWLISSGAHIRTALTLQWRIVVGLSLLKDLKTLVFARIAHWECEPVHRAAFDGT